MTTMKSISMKNLAKQICIYNGQRGTEKQIEKCIKLFHGSFDRMKQFATARFDLKQIK